jgi:hypothetical protein
VLLLKKSRTYGVGLVIVGGVSRQINLYEATRLDASSARPGRTVKKGEPTPSVIPSDPQFEQERGSRSTRA